MEGADAPILAGLADLVLLHAGVFARIAAAIAVLPGMGERVVPPKVKLGLALGLTLVVAPLVHDVAGPPPRTPLGLAALLAAEAAAGLVIGVAFRLLVIALQIAGAVAAQSVGIAQLFGGVTAESEPSIATFLMLGGIALAMAAGMHVALVAGLAELYVVLPYGLAPSGDDLASWGVARVGGTFALGLSLALPFVAVGFAYNLALGALSRAMPQLLVALVGAPLIVALGLAVLWLALPELFGRWLDVAALVFAAPLSARP
ncbi:flagellar biosynthetic protein FliR [Limibaculum sp. M0105]|uniref:Flagellar biosynthetic protein FliR n=1 Tax=Thermohalobaculum xanthum TaxID=2753746 RepID=A0A8J7M4D6_9RHOB|nr:flagellar biosynthetic protein FliR [Thermohalobaculum xanthum]MBK0398106.1 flagellar biosynthetic protein FliR [Thermohalobaculum xanthum]